MTRADLVCDVLVVGGGTAGFGAAAAAVALRAGVAVQAVDGRDIAARLKAQGLWGLA